MSAYICSPEHFAALAAFAVKSSKNGVISEWRDHSDPTATARKVATELARENIRSVATRYPGDRELPGPDMSPAEIMQAAANLAESYYWRPPTLSPVDLLKMCQGYAYQSCETQDWRDSLAHRQIEWIESSCYSMLPGYDAAPWSYDGDGRDIRKESYPVLLKKLVRR